MKKGPDEGPFFFDLDEDLLATEASEPEFAVVDARDDLVVAACVLQSAVELSVTAQARFQVVVRDRAFTRNRLQLCDEGISDDLDVVLHGRSPWLQMDGSGVSEADEHLLDRHSFGDVHLLLRLRHTALLGLIHMLEVTGLEDAFEGLSLFSGEDHLLEGGLGHGGNSVLMTRLYARVDVPVNNKNDIANSSIKSST